MLKNTHIGAALLAIMAGSATAQTVTFLPGGYFGTDLSFDGRVMVGNVIGSFEAFYNAEGFFDDYILLGEATNPVLGTGAGAPDVSDDGTAVSATILDSSGTKQTMGIWTRNTGWTRMLTMPVAPDGLDIDNSFASCWCLSGDGTAVGGFYWNDETPGQAGGAKAQPTSCAVIDAPVAFPTTVGRNARVNDLNGDGTMGCGWMERADGVWQPAIWRDGNIHFFTTGEAFNQCRQMNSDGSIVVGEALNIVNLISEPNMWTWNGTSYDRVSLGRLPGTPQASNALIIPWGLVDDGSMVVGQNLFSFSPGGASKGFIWTSTDLMMEAEEFLATKGIDITDEITIRSVDAVSDDGSAIVVSGLHPVTGTLRSAKIRLVPLDTTTLCAADFNGDYVVDIIDFGMFGSAFGSMTGDVNYDPVADFNDDGVVDIIDFGVFGAEFGNGPGICEP